MRGRLPEVAPVSRPLEVKNRGRPPSPPDLRWPTLIAFLRERPGEWYEITEQVDYPSRLAALLRGFGVEVTVRRPKGETVARMFVRWPRWEVDPASGLGIVRDERVGSWSWSQ